ncbi:uncharacterized protein LOC122246467 [Penaeus japonicus]|uniref:uncharacterized protein LOC122246467 n=1 Tax=Penaeus japonicus TaxID=27405 RepID=UPI001C7135B1|nr:uncharacterized protein LOC122246467 [Penaeus japonicus]XP_042860984.1 uncharacterized protein LOC122246467 [Penaeus japonicus]
MAGASTGGRRGRACLGVLAVIDSLLSIFIFAPLVVGYWRGCWQLMDIYLLPGNKQLSVLTSLAIGNVSGLVFCLLQGPLAAVCDNERRPRLHLLVSRLYTAVYCVCCVNHWRGVWAAWDLYTGISWQSGATSAGIGLLTLALTRGLKNILAPPFIVVTDHPSGYFKVPTLFSTKVGLAARSALAHALSPRSLLRSEGGMSLKVGKWKLDKKLIKDEVAIYNEIIRAFKYP